MKKESRPWGYYIILAEAPDHKVKKICVSPKKRLSLQRHQQRSEHWYVLSGEALVTLDKEQFLLGAGESINIPPLGIHRVENEGSEDLIFIEIQKGSYFGEDDIERFEDDYGRA